MASASMGTDQADEGLEAVLANYLRAAEEGRAPDRMELLARHPDLAPELAAYFAGQERFTRLAAPLRDAVSAVQESTIDQMLAEGGRLGDFRIIREIGRGGMGVVYEAEQISLGRRVALKVLPFAGALDAKQLQRFKNEAHAAAHLQHQNIVPVYAVGSERGVHFYAMQFVDGQTLAALIQELRQASQKSQSPPASPHINRQLTGPYTAEPKSPAMVDEDRPQGEKAAATIEDRAALIETISAPPRSSILDSPSSFFRTVAYLGIQAAEALEHAHQLGVIHRDIKPANLMVENSSLITHHSSLRLWITDFGLAHCQGGCELTMSGDLLGTLRYMSPEQALAKRVIVDERTDIYSLGVTLYELLTLEPAFPGIDRQEVLRQIAFDDPKQPRRLNKAIPEELETIILKAMEKSPADRYSTAQELADDLRRYLEDIPIRARRPTALARMRKWSYRHRGPVSAAVASAVLVLAVTSAIIAWQWRAAVEAKSQSEQSASTVRAINHFLINDLLNASTPQQSLGRKVTVEEVLENAGRKIEGAFPNEPQVEAGVRMALASAYSSLGLWAKAEPHLQRASAIRQALLGGEHPDTLETQKELGLLWRNQNKYHEAEELCRKILETARHVMGDEDKLTLKLEHLIAEVLMEEDRLDESEELFRRCLPREIRILGEDNLDTLETMSQFAVLLGARRHNWKEAEPLGRRCIEVRERTLGKDHPDTLDARDTFADSILRVEGKFKEAETLHRETLEIARHVLPPKHEITLTLEHNLGIVLLSLDLLEEAEKYFRESVKDRGSFSSPDDPELLKSRRFLGEVLVARGKLDEAEQLFSEVLELNRRVQGPDATSTLVLLAGIANVHRAKGRWAEAETTVQQTLDTCLRRHGPEDPITLQLTSLQAVLLEEVGKHAEAGPALRATLQTRRRTLPQEHPWLAFALYSWAEHLLVEGELQRAEPALEEAIGIERAALPAGHRALGQALAAQGWLQACSGRAQQGEPLLREGLRICRRAFPAGHWVPAEAASRLGGCMMALRQFTEAEALLLSGYQTLQSTPGAPPPRRLEALERIVKLYETWGKADKAAEWQAKRLSLPKPAEKEDGTRKDK